MFKKFYLVLIPYCLFAFQNCGGAGDSTSSSNTTTSTKNFTPLLQDSMTDIQSFEFYHYGGLVGPGVITTHDLVIVYDQTSQTATATDYAAKGASTKTCSTNLTTNEISSFLTNLTNAYLALDGSMGVIVDAGDYHFITHLNNGTSQEYLFVGGDNSHASIVIFGQALRDQLVGLITTLDCHF